MQSGRTRLVSAVVAAVMAITVIGVTPAMAQEEECRGGSPDYWLANPWPEPFKVPKAFRMPNGKVATVQPWTKFDNVFRYRQGRDQEGRIFPGQTLKQVLKLKGNAKRGLARQTIAALLNRAESSNDFDWTTNFAIIKDFQVYWDGTEDMGKTKARNFMQERFREWNNLACPSEPAA
jgi:hypothetical protein